MNLKTRQGKNKTKQARRDRLILTILLISGYDALSHQKWRKGLVDTFPAYQFECIALAPRHFFWRSLSNGLELLEHDALKKEYDIVLATSVVDMPTLRAILPRLGKRWLVYFHENQFAYPSKEHKHFDFNLVMRDVKRARVADDVAFNSDFNRNSYFHGLRTLIKTSPKSFGSEVLENISAKSRIVPVGVDELWFESRPKPSRQGVCKLLWNHRWEYDKGPDDLLSLVEKLIRANFEFELYIAGQPFRKIPDSFLTIQEKYPDLLKQFGKVDVFEDYRKLVCHCDAVISTSIHEFQGLSMLESMAFGCVGFAPNRLVYPEYIESSHLYEDVSDLCQKIQHWWTVSQDFKEPNLDSYRWSELKSAYESWFRGN